MFMCMYIYIYREREREREIMFGYGSSQRGSPVGGAPPPAPIGESTII